MVAQLDIGNSLRAGRRLGTGLRYISFIHTEENRMERQLDIAICVSKEFTALEEPDRRPRLERS
jgi:hypothetical protein